MSDVTITFAIVAGIVTLFVWDRIPVVLVSLGTALALYFTGVTTLKESPGRPRRSGRDLHCVAFRRQCRPGRHSA